jgi:4-hydroxyphenylpyruvate dioxygenase
MTSPTPLGIRRLEALIYYVHDLERSRRFYTTLMDFAETGASTAAHEDRVRERSAVFEAGGCTIVVTEPLDRDAKTPAASFLRRHPDGIGTLVFEVADAAHALATLEARGATPITDLVHHHDGHGELVQFEITSPFGSTTLRFVERRGFRAPAAGIDRYDAPRGGNNAFGFTHFDHVTSNFSSMSPALLWMEHVLGCVKFWEVEFHTDDVAGPRSKGSGLKSQVMWERESGVRFANNEPRRPHFHASQIALFVEDHRGDGVQHAALAVADVLSAVRALRARGVEFMPTPGSYYDLLPARIERLGIGKIDEDIATLRELEVLVDGAGEGQYMLQIFLKDSAGLYREPEAGPFFFEIIQRKGDQGFGAGNFRALFESIEREQKSSGRL